MKRSARLATTGTLLAAGVVGGLAANEAVGSIMEDRAIVHELGKPELANKLGETVFKREVVLVGSGNSKDWTEFANNIGVVDEERANFVKIGIAQTDGNVQPNTQYVVGKDQLDGHTLVPMEYGHTKDSGQTFGGEQDAARNPVLYYVPPEVNKH